MDALAVISALSAVAGVAVAVLAWRWPRPPVPWPESRVAATAVTGDEPALIPAASTVLTAERRQLQIFAWGMFLLFPGVAIFILGYLAWFLESQQAGDLYLWPLSIVLALASYVAVRQAILLTQPLDLTLDHHGIILRLAGRTWAVPWELVWHATVRPHRFMPTLFIWINAPRASGLFPAEAVLRRFPGFPGHVERHKAIALAPAFLFSGGSAAVLQAIRRHARFAAPVSLPTKADTNLKSALTVLAWAAIIGMAVFLVLYQQAQSRTILEQIFGDFAP